MRPIKYLTTSDNSTQNLQLRGARFLVDNVEVRAAPCQAGADLEGSQFEVRNSWFAFNGWAEPGPWADGITVFRCDNGYIHHNEFWDNTDIDLVVGGGPNCRVEFNNIRHTQDYGFAGIHVGYFDSGAGNHSGSTYFGNTVSSGFDKLAFGIVVGFHPWKTNLQLSDTGRVISNTVSGAVINLAIEASFSTVVGEVTGNSLSGAQGSNGLGNCTISTNYTVYQPHASGITFQGAWFELQYDNGECIPF